MNDLDPADADRPVVHQLRVVILDAGRATIEIADPGNAAIIDEVEVGRRVADHIRLAFEVDDTTSATAPRRGRRNGRRTARSNARGSRSTSVSRVQPGYS